MKKSNKNFFKKTLPLAFLFSGLGMLISALNCYKFSLPFEAMGSITTNFACNLVLGLLLVFRTNTAYDRFSQARIAWGTITINIRNISREIQIQITENSPEMQQKKIQILKLLCAFALTTKLHLREETLNNELDQWIDTDAKMILEKVSNPPLQITFWISDYIHQAYQRNKIESYQQGIMINYINELVEGLTACDRIRTTPTPSSYQHFLRNFLLTYCSLLPLSLVDSIHQWTGLTVGVISLILFSVQQIANELEDPFGYDDIDLPLEDICQTLLDNVKSAIAFNEDDHLSQTSREV